MTKKHTTLNVDDKLMADAKRAFINVSEITEKAIRDKLNQKEVIIEHSDKCEFCSKEEKKATAENPIGLTWLWPDERWICNSCLSHKSRSASLTGA